MAVAEPVQQQQGQAPADSHASMMVDTPALPSASVSTAPSPALVPIAAPAHLEGDRALALSFAMEEREPIPSVQDETPFTESAASSSSAGAIVSESQAETQPPAPVEPTQVADSLAMPAGSEL